MPCDISDSLKCGCETVFGLKFFNSIFSSTLWTAFLITAIVILLLMILIPVECDTSASILFKFMFYTFLSVLGILFLHNGVLSIRKDEAEASNISSDLATRMEGGVVNITSEDDVEVKPTIISRNGLDPIFAKYGV